MKFFFFLLHNIRAKLAQFQVSPGIPASSSSPTNTTYQPCKAHISITNYHMITGFLSLLRFHYYVFIYHIHVYDPLVIYKPLAEARLQHRRMSHNEVTAAEDTGSDDRQPLRMMMTTCCCCPPILSTSPHEYLKHRAALYFVF